MTNPSHDLRWYYRDAEAELGSHSVGMPDHHGGAPGDYEPTQRQCRAAARERDIRWQLERLSVAHRRVLELAYMAGGDDPYASLTSLLGEAHAAFQRSRG